MITRALRREIGRVSRSGESVESTLRRLFAQRGHDVGRRSGIVGGRMLLARAKTTIRITRPLKGWLVKRMEPYETPDHAIRRLAGLAPPEEKTRHGR